MNTNETEIARVLGAAQITCLQYGSASADDVAEATGYDLGQVKDFLAALARRGELVARPGGLYARGLVREVRLPGSSWKFGIVSQLPPARLMRGR